MFWKNDSTEALCLLLELRKLLVTEGDIGMVAFIYVEVWSWL